MENLTKKASDGIMSFFGGDPSTTTIGQKIEQATDPSLASENWALNMEITDMINMSEDAAKDAARAIHKKLKQNAGKNYTVIMYTLTVLETCVKNCGKRFHVLVCHKDFVQNLVTMIGPKNDPPLVVQEKVLGMIQSWADTFQGQPELSGVVQVYQELKSKGIEFPMTDLDSMAPILTPKRSVETEPILHQVDLGERQVKVNVDQATKIRRDLEVVQSNMNVFSEILSELKPGQENRGDMELLEELHTACKEMQRRIAELLCSISSDELTAELLHINDELNNLFLRYGRYKKNTEKTQQQKQPEPSLIDFGGGDPDVAGASNKMKGLNVGGAQHGKDDADFDSFAASRTDKPPLTEEDILMGHKASDFDEMEAWLRANPGTSGSGGAPAGSGDGETLTSSEFDKFLADRAAAAASNSSGTSGRPPSSDHKS